MKTLLAVFYTYYQTGRCITGHKNITLTLVLIDLLRNYTKSKHKDPHNEKALAWVYYQDFYLIHL